MAHSSGPAPARRAVLLAFVLGAVALVGMCVLMIAAMVTAGPETTCALLWGVAPALVGANMCGRHSHAGQTVNPRAPSWLGLALAAAPGVVLVAALVLGAQVLPFPLTAAMAVEYALVLSVGYLLGALDTSDR